MKTYFCDGCAQPMLGEPAHLGHILIRDYCPACLIRAQEFQDAEEQLRKKTYEQFTDERALLIATAGFKLPDVP